VADFIFNRAKGRHVEFFERINANDPVNSRLELRLIAATGVEADATLRDLDDFTALVAGATNFATNTGAVAKFFDNTSGNTITYDDTNDRVDTDLVDTTWTALANDGTGAVSDIVSGYDSDSTAGTDTNIIPVSFHDFVITPDGSDVTAQINVLTRAS
jgi:hypothetical protein